MNRSSVGVLASFSAAACFFIISIIPVVLMLAKAFTVNGAISLANFCFLISDARQTTLFARSMLIAAGATLAALAMGLPMAFYIHDGHTKTAKWANRLYLLPLTIPPQVFATTTLSFMAMIGLPLAGSAPPAIGPKTATIIMVSLLLALAYHPLVVLTALTGLKAMDRRLMEAASLFRGSVAVFVHIRLGLLRPYILTGAVFVFLFSMFNYGIPALLGIHNYPVEIFSQFSAFYNENLAAAMAFPLIVTAAILLVLLKIKMGSRAFFTISTGSNSADNGCSAVTNKFLALCSWGTITLSVLAPLGILAVKAASFQVIIAVLRTSFREIADTFLFAACAASLLIVTIYPLSDRITHSPKRLWKIMNGLSLLPFAVPATVLGIGLIYLWNRPFLDFVYGSAAMVVIAFTARFSAFAVHILNAGMGQVTPVLLEAAMLVESSPLRRWRLIEWPLTKQNLSAGWLICFVLCMNELGTTLLVIPPGYGTLSLKIYNLMHYGANRMVAGMALLLVAINLVVATMVFRVCFAKKEMEATNGSI